MRTTVTLDPDVDAIVRRMMRERGMTFKEALNEAIRNGGNGGRRRRAFRTSTFEMGAPAFPLDKAARLAGELEEEALIRKPALRK